MGLLSGEFTDQDMALDETRLTDPKTFKRGALADTAFGAVSGAAKGVTSVSNALSRVVEGDEVADRRLQQANEALTPLNQGTAGHITSGITEVLAAGAVGSPLGAVGVATTVGLGTRASEHSRLTQQLGVDQETADTASNLFGATNAAMAFLPVSNVFKQSLALDYAALVAVPTAVGQASIYAEGDYLEANGYKKQGEMYKDMATDPTAILTNLTIGSVFFAGSRYLSARSNPDLSEAQVHQAEAEFNNVVDQAQADADRSSIPTTPESAGDLLQHQQNINQAIEQVMKGEKVNISEATGGQLKSLQDVRAYIKSNNTPNNTTIKPSINTTTRAKPDLQSTASADLNTRINDSYHLAQDVGFSPDQARALVGEIGRENGFNLKTMFGFHTDQANFKKNGGIFSWQGNRAIALEARMQAKGLMNADGTFKQNNAALKEQLSFLHDEIQANPKWKASFLDKKNISNEEARVALGGKGSIIGWARGQTKLKSGLAFDWQAHEARANQFSDMVDGQALVAHTVDDTTTSVPTKDLSNLDSTVHRVDLESFPKIDENFLDLATINTFMESSSRPKADLEPDFSLLESPVPSTPNTKLQAQMKELDQLFEDLSKPDQYVSVPHTAKRIQVKDTAGESKTFQPDESIAVAWKENQRYQKGKPHQELTRSYKDQDGNTVQEMKYKDVYLNRLVDSAQKTISIHVGRSNKSDFVNHKGNKQLETALNRIFDHNNYGYLSQIPKGHEAITKLEADPNLVISSKKTGEDLTAQQWKDKLIREQDNITMLSKAMLTLAKCALKQAS